MLLAVAAGSTVATGAELQVRIVDRAGAAVAGATLELESLGSQGAAIAAATTDDQGVAAIIADAAGSYRARVTADGFVNARSTALTLDAASPTTLTLALYPGSWIEGRVLGPGDQPVQDAEVCVELRDWERLPVEAIETTGLDDGGLCLHSDPEGRISSDVLPLGEYRVTVEAAGLVAAASRLQLERGAEPMTWSLEQGGRITGRLQNREEQPVAGAVVRARHRESGTPAETTTDAEGAFVAEGLAVGHWELRIEPPRSATILRDGLDVTAGGTVDLGMLRTRPGLSVEGLVIDAAGEVAAGTEITALDSGRVPRRLRSATSDDQGRFVIAGLGEDPVHLLAKGAEGYAPATLEEIQPPSSGTEIHLAKTGRVCGRVVTADGGPAGGVSVSARAQIEDSLLTRYDELLLATTREVEPESGAFCIDDVYPAEEVVVLARAQGYQPKSTTIAVAPGSEPAPVELVLERGLTLEGTVTDTNGLPIAEAGVRSRGGTMVFSDLVGEFRLDGLAAGMNRIDVTHQDYAPEQREVMLPLAEGDRLELRLSAGGTIEGEVRRFDGRPAKGIPIGLESPPLRALTDADGRYRLERVPPGERTITRASPGRYDDFEHRRVQVVEGESLRVDFVLGVVLEGQVTRAGVPLPGVALALAQPHDVARFVDASHAVRRTFSDERGAYRLAGVQPGWGTLTVEERRQTLVRPLEVPHTEHPRVDLRLPDRPIRGSVVRASDESPVAGAYVTVELTAVDGAPQSGGSRSYSSFSGGEGIFYSLTSRHEVKTHTDDRGLFELFVDTAPQVSVGAWLPGFEYKHVNVDPDSPTPLVLRLERQVKLVVLLYDSHGRPTQSSRVCVASIREDSRSESCNVGGSGRSEHTVREGPVTIRAGASGFGSQVLERELSVDPGQDEQRLEFHLVPGAPLRVRLVGQSNDEARIVSLIDPTGRDRTMLAEARDQDPATGDVIWDTWPLEPGSWQVSVDTGFGDTLSREVVIVPGQRAELVLP